MLEQELNAKLNNQQLKADELSKANAKNVQSHYAFNKPIIPPVSISSLYSSMWSLYYRVTCCGLHWLSHYINKTF